MIIHSLTLQNIRSYQEQTVEFSEGITLLAGDIGSGKSSILLAIEFALFGIRRGDISGDGLLRHGEAQGSVTLTFSTDQTYTIHRALKRSSQGVRQDGGYLEINGVQESLTANELKARIIYILGYPEALLTKTKGFVFRYTVYTPQEEMKQILFENDQSRLDALRAVFGVDRYQLIQENATTVAKALRDDKRFLTGQLADEEELSERLRARRQQLATTQEGLKAAKQAHAAATEQLKTTQQALAQVKESFEQELARQKKHSALVAKQEALQRQVVQLTRSIGDARSLLSDKQDPIPDPSPALTEVSERITVLKEKRAQARAKRQERQARIAELSEKLSRVQELSTCPVCQQDVGSGHKDHIRQDVEKELGTLKEKLSTLTQVLERLDGALTEQTHKQQSLEQRKRVFERQQETLRKQEEARKRVTELSEQERALTQELSSLQKELRAVSKPLQDPQLLAQAEQRVETAQQKVAQEHVRVAQLSERQSQLAAQAEELKKRKQRLLDVKRERERIGAQERWLSELFIPATGVMEKHVLAAVHQEFSRLFTQWCSLLLDDEHVFATLSTTFSPQVTNQGYDADLAHLSGGEKTSLALAYRLALNAVVNEFIQSLNTRDVLILDEPTDGFSSQQLDRVRDVLKELSLRQVIIVSHEQKMQGFVDQVVTVRRVENVSLIE